jgi:hypothetical protein
LIEIKQNSIVISQEKDGEEISREIVFVDSKEKKPTGWRYDFLRQRVIFLFIRRKIVGIDLQDLEEVDYPVDRIVAAEGDLRKRKFLLEEEKK